MPSPRRGTLLPVAAAIGLAAILLLPGLSVGAAPGPVRPATPPPRLAPSPAAADRLTPPFAGFSHQTLTLLNGTVLAGNPYLPSGNDPTIARADPAAARIFLISGGNGGRASLDAVDSTNNTLLGELPLPPNPTNAIVVTSHGQLVVVASGGPSELTVVNATSLTVVATIPLANWPESAILDPANGEEFVLCDGGPWGSIVGVVNLTSDTVLQWIPVGGGPSSIVDDPANGFLYVANSGTDNISVINGTNNSLAATIPAGGAPLSMAVDPGNDTLYVLDQNTAVNRTTLNLTVVNLTANTVHAAVPIYSPWNSSGSLAFDPGSNQLYVALDSVDALTIVAAANNSVAGVLSLGYAPYEVSPDPIAGGLVVSYWQSGEVTFVSTSNDTVLGNVSAQDGGTGFTVDPSNGRVDIANAERDQLEILNPTARTVYANVSVGVSPDGILYDPFSGDLYVTEGDQGGVTILNGSTDALVGTVLTGAGASHIELCPSVDRVFVTNPGALTVSVLNATTNGLVATVPIVGGPGGMAWDPADGKLYVTSGGGNVSVLNGTTGALVATVNGFQYPTRLVFDPADQEVYVMDGWGGPIGVVNGTTYRVVANVTLGNGTPVDIQYEPSTAEVWGVTSWPGVLMAISGRSNAVVANLSLPTPGIWGMAVEPVSGTIVVSLWGDAFSGVEEFVNATSVSKIAVAQVDMVPSSILFDERRGLALVSNVESADISVINLTTHKVVDTVRSGANPTNLAIDPATDTSYCTNNGVSSLTVLGPPVSHPVVFTESGLPRGTNWSVSLDDLNASSTTPVVTIGAPNGTHAYSVSPSPGFLPLPAAGNVTVAAAGVNVPIQFVPAFAVVFTESGLPTGTTWAVSVNGTAERGGGRAIAFQESNGSYGYRVLDVPGWRAGGYGGTVEINGTPDSVRLNWTRAEYDVNFTAGRLPAGKSWAVLLNGTTYRDSFGTIDVPLPNGTYSFSIEGAPGYAPIIATGSLTIQGSSLSWPVNFTAGYLVQFQEFGLPDGMSWSATVNGSRNESASPLIGFEVPNGTFVYHLENVPGWRTDAYSGYLSVDDWPQVVNVTWNRTTYPVWFTESGLPFGKSWSATVAGLAINTTNYAKLVREPNGSFPFTVGNVPGWRANAYSGSFNVSAGATTVTVYWTQSLFPLSFSESGLPDGALWSIRLNGGPLLTSTAPTLVATVPNGTESYEVGYVGGFRANAYHGYVTVVGPSGGATILWSPTLYPVEIAEHGLPTGAPWAVWAFGATNRSATSSITWMAPNGTYPFAILNVPGWRASIYNGAVRVDSGPAILTVDWSRSTYGVVVTASGLPVGASWTAVVDGTAYASHAAMLLLPALPNGTYSFSSSSTGFEARAAPAAFTVEGTNVSIGVTFVAPHGGSAVSSPILLVGTAAIGIVAAVGLILHLRRSSRIRPPMTTR